MSQLTSEERDLLRNGLGQWGSPARCSDNTAAVIGYSDAVEFYADLSRMIEMFNNDSLPTSIDLYRALLTTEIVFVSDSLGAGT